MKNFNPFVFIFIALVSLASASFTLILNMLTSKRLLPPNAEQLVQSVQHYGVFPVVVFALFFSLACLLRPNNRGRVTLNEVFGFTLLVPFMVLGVMFLLMFTTPYLVRAKIPLELVRGFFGALMIALLARGLLYLEMGGIALIGCGVVGVLAKFMGYFPELKLAMELWYGIIGVYLAYFAARKF